LLVPQTNGVQEVVPVVPHAPAPLQDPASVSTVPTHDAPPHETFVPACWQVPLALQKPVLPQVPLGAQPARGAALPAGTFVHVPRLPVRLQAWQVPQTLLPQQTPSAQKPEPHSVVVVQAAPRLFLATQLPPVPVQ
jgi:hypothetical protein